MFRGCLIGEYWRQQLEESGGRRLLSMTKELQELPEEKEDERKAEFENVCTLVEDALGKRVEEVVIPVGLC